MRIQSSLAGTWEFQVDPEGTLDLATIAPDRNITVPLPWQAAFPDLQQYSGYAWYRRTFELDDAWLAGELLLHFGAVDYWCQVFVNGQLVAEHEGGYMPIDAAIRAYARAGQNELAVRVYDSAQSQIAIHRWAADATPKPRNAPPFSAADVPHGKQEWYLNVGGIWQDVMLTAVPASYVGLLHVTPDIHTGQARVVAELAGARAAGTLAVTIADAEGRNWAGSAEVAAGQASAELTIAVENPQLWDMDSPVLYTASATLTTDGGEDMLDARFGFREISTRDGQLLLNGAPLFLLSALDQDLYPDTIYTVPSDDYLRDQFQKAKQLGLNSLRCHIKPPDPRYLDLADELGLLIWAEIPSWRTFHVRSTLSPERRDLGDEIKRRAEQILVEMIRRDFNHPALMIWTIVNEDWGTSLPLSTSDRAWVAEMYARCKQADPTRLVVDNSLCLHSWGPNIHVRSDIDDIHIYTNIPDQAESWVQTIEQFNLRPLWTYTSNGDAQRTGGEPLILSEFGNWGLPSLQKISGPNGEEPHWFNLGPWWSSWDGEPGWPHKVAERFAQLGLGAIWPDYEAFTTATQWHQFAAMKFEIEAMRRQPNLAGYVITEFTDAYWESNGLLDFYRNTKAYHEQFATINAPDVIVPQLDRYAVWDDQSLAMRVHLAHYSAADWAGASLRWRVGHAAGEHAAPALPRGGVAELGRARWRLPAAEAAHTATIELELAGERALATNRVEVLVLPAEARRARYTGNVAVVGRSLVGKDWADESAELVSDIAPPDVGIDPTQTQEALVSATDGETKSVDLERALSALGYHTSRKLAPDTDIVVTTFPTAELLSWVRDGGDMLFICQGSSPFFWAHGRGGAYSGNWMTSFSWLRPDAHSRLGAVSSPLGLPFMRVMPKLTILGIPAEDPAVQPDLLAGMVSGWVGHPSVHTAQFRYGRGRVVMTTFALEEALATEPVAVAMLHDLVEYLASEACRPTLAANY